MTQTRAQSTPAETLVSLQTYLHGLESGKPDPNGVTIADLIGGRVDRVRLFQESHSNKVKVIEVTLPKGTHGAGRRRKRYSSGL